MMETELWFYAMVTKNDGFDQAVSNEIHEQWEYKIPSEDGQKKKQRVRATTKDGVTIYTETLKIETKGENNNVLSHKEPTVEINEDYFRAWIEAFGTTGVNKIRYTFLSKNVELTIPDHEPITLPELTFEVDILINAGGQRSKWCKVDIEIDKALAYLEQNHPDIKSFDVKVALSSLPLGLENAFSGAEEGEEYQEATKRFWDSFAIKKPGQE